MQSITLIGILAGSLTTIAFLPQVLKTWRSRSAADLSTGMLLLFSGGLILWLVYGIAIRALPIILANAVTLLLTFAILLMKWRFEVRTARAGRKSV
jgi:MtN3 and saliva related transmembrane protein